MRVPTEAPRRRFRLRGWLIALVVIIVVLLFSLRGLAGFYTDFLWFDSLGQGSTWSSLLAAKVAPALVFTVVFFAIMFVNLVIADRLAPKYRSTGPEDELIARYQQATGRYTGRIRIGVSLFFALIAGIGVSSQWQQWVLFTNATDFGIKDPQFNMDIGFYVFKLPFLEFIAEWLFAGLVIVLIVTAVEHYLNGGIRFQAPFQRVTPQVKAHLSVILAIMALVKTSQYWLGRFELTTSTRGVVEGAGYTNVKAELPALNLLIIISVVAAGLFIWNIRRRGWVLPIIAVGLWGFVSLVIGTIYPAAIQQFRVGPDEFAKEAPYIARNIKATRDAFDIDDVETDDFEFQTFPNIENPDAVVATNLATIDNARLWDPDVIQDTFSGLQSLQTYYQIGDVDVDRYLIDNEVRQVLIAARGLNSADLPSQSFVNRHIVYTHGYGVVASPSNEAVAEGAPRFFLSNIPTEVEPNTIEIDGKASEIYFGEGLSGYVLTGAQQSEFNYQRAGRTDSFNRYTGEDGVTLSNIVRRAAFALRFGDINPLISGQIDSDTKIHLERDIRARVSKLAPFLNFDADPYPVLLRDRLLWVMDGYTTSSRYPYSQSITGEGGLGTSFNYVRNSVKVTVDAYDGTVTLYAFDEADPVLRAWRKAFPDLFTDESQMPPKLREHLRYPEDLLKVQSTHFGRYHVEQPRRFYEGSSAWLISPDPGSGVLGQEAIAALGVDTTDVPANGEPQSATSTGRRVDPYYLYIKLPGDDSEQFVAITPFVPVSAANAQTRLVSFLSASSDPDQYGELRAFEMPQGENVRGPAQVNNDITRNDGVSRAITLLGARSQVIQGSLQPIPVGNSIIYVRPFYAQGRGQGSYPQFQFVVVYTQDIGVACAQTVNQGLQRLFGEGESTESDCNQLLAETGTDTETDADGDDGDGTEPTTTTTTPASTTTTAPPTGQTVQELVSQAAQKLVEADAARLRGDLGEYQRLVSEAQALIRAANSQ